MLDIHSLVDGSLIKKIPGPIGTVCAISGSKKHSELFYTYISFTSPGTIFRCDLSQSPIPDPEVTTIQKGIFKLYSLILI